MVAATAIGVLLVAASGGCRRAEAPPFDASAIELPSPNLEPLGSTLEPELVAARERALDIVRRRGARPAEAANAIGRLGQLYHAYELRDAARACYELAARLVPEEARWHYYAALVEVHSGDPQRAANRLERVLELDPELVIAWIRLGEVELGRGRLTEADGAFARAHALASDDAAASYGLGRVAAAQGDVEAAITHFQRTLELQPQASVVHYALAQALRQRGGAGDAAAADRHLELRGDEQVELDDPFARELGQIRGATALQVVANLAASPEEASAEQLLGFALAQLDQTDGAIELLENWLASRLDEAAGHSGGAPAEPDRSAEAERPAAACAGCEPAEAPASEIERARLRFVLGGLSARRGDDEGASRHFEEATRLVPSFVEAHDRLGSAFMRRGLFERAVASYQRALELRPNDADLRLRHATALLNLGRLAEARAALERLLEDDPGDAAVRVRLAEVREAGGDARAAEQELLAGLARATGDEARARLHRGLGDLYQRGGAFERAADSYQEALSLDPHASSVRLQLAAVLGHLGRLAESSREYRRVIVEDPRNVFARRGEAAALLLTGDQREARARLEEAVAVVPADPVLTGLLARVLAASADPLLRDGERALELATTAHRLDASPLAAETVAMAYAELGRYDEAASWQRRAIEQGGRDTAALGRLELYGRHSPFRAERPEDLLGPPPGR